MTFRLIAMVFLVIWGSSSAFAQTWGPTTASDPWGVYGTKVCSSQNRNAAGHFCFAVFCNAPNEPLVFGYENVAFGGEGHQDVIASVDRLQSWPMTLTLLPDRDHQVGVTYLDPARLPGFYQSLRAGNRLYLDTRDGWEHMLALSGSNAELARLEGICAPVRPLRLDEIDVTRIGQPHSAPQPAPQGDTGIVQQIPAPDASRPVVPQVPAPMIGAADWEEVPDMDGEGLVATRLCFPERRGEDAARCLHVGCYEGWRDASILFEDRAFPARDWRGSPEFQIIVSRSDRVAGLPLTVNPDAQTLIAAGLAAQTDWPRVASIVREDGPLRLDLPFGAVTLMAGNAQSEWARVSGFCTFPQEAPARMSMAESKGGTLRAVDMAALSPAFNTDGVGIVPLFFQVHGSTINQYRSALREMPSEMGYIEIPTPSGRLVVSRLCGRGGWFGANGCMGYLHKEEAGSWRLIFSDTEQPYGRAVSIDFGSINAGWPDIVIDNGAARWTFDGTAYQIVR